MAPEIAAARRVDCLETTVAVAGGNSGVTVLKVAPILDTGL
jgi:hypothetical protein